MPQRRLRQAVSLVKRARLRAEVLPLAALLALYACGGGRTGVDLASAGRASAGGVDGGNAGEGGILAGAGSARRGSAGAVGGGSAGAGGSGGAGAGCEPGRGDCDGNGTCETNVHRTVEHCGACNARCDYPNAQEVCVSGVCTLIGCPEGRYNCDGSSLNGCESSRVCNGIGGPGCPPGRADCGYPAGSCAIDLLTSSESCGRCGRLCSPVVDSGRAHCISGQCTVTWCPRGRFDCNGDPFDGCEHRGVCGSVAGAGGSAGGQSGASGQAGVVWTAGVTGRAGVTGQAGAAGSAGVSGQSGATGQGGAGHIGGAGFGGMGGMGAPMGGMGGAGVMPVFSPCPPP